MNITEAQWMQIRLLVRCQAFDSGSAASVYDGARCAGPLEVVMNPRVISRLAGMGLASSRVSRVGGSQRTLYWLTEAGRDLYRKRAERIANQSDRAVAR